MPNPRIDGKMSALPEGHTLRVEGGVSQRKIEELPPKRVTGSGKEIVNITYTNIALIETIVR